MSFCRASRETYTEEQLGNHRWCLRSFNEPFTQQKQSRKLQRHSGMTLPQLKCFITPPGLSMMRAKYLCCSLSRTVNTRAATSSAVDRSREDTVHLYRRVWDEYECVLINWGDFAEGSGSHWSYCFRPLWTGGIIDTDGFKTVISVFQKPCQVKLNIS